MGEPAQPSNAIRGAMLGRAMGMAEHPALETIHQRVRSKLEREPVEDFRIDFEDGFRALALLRPFDVVECSSLPYAHVPVLAWRCRRLAR